MSSPVPWRKDCAIICVMEKCADTVRLMFVVLAMSSSAAALADTPVLATAAPPVAAPASATTNAATLTPNNQIWECTTNGLRTFSSNPCGTKSTVRQLNPINVMEPVPVYRPANSYPQNLWAPSAPVRYSHPDPDGAQDSAADTGYSGYPGVIVVQRARHVRPNTVRPHPQPHPHHP